MKHDVKFTKEQRAHYDRVLREFNLGGDSRRMACLEVGIMTNDFETGEFIDRLIACALEV